MDNGLGFALAMIGALIAFGFGFFCCSLFEHFRESKKS